MRKGRNPQAIGLGVRLPCVCLALTFSSKRQRWIYEHENLSLFLFLLRLASKIAFTTSTTFHNGHIDNHDWKAQAQPNFLRRARPP